MPNRSSERTEQLVRCAQDVIRLARATIPEELSDDSWFVIENLVFMAMESVRFADTVDAGDGT